MGELCRDTLFPPDTPAPVSNALVMLKGQLAHLCAQAASIRVADYEAAGPEPLGQLTQRSQALVTSALEALDVAAVLFCEPEPTIDEATSASEWDDRVSTPPIEVDGIGETMFLARMGLQSRRRLLASSAEVASSWERLSSAGSALRTIQKSLSAVERAMCEARQLAPSLSFYDQAVSTSLEVRRRYVDLHQDVTRLGPPQDGELRGRLRSIGNAFARILGLSIAPDLRTEDRALLMMSRSKVRDWLTHREDDAAHVAAGHRLWQDISSITTMFLDVNKREELVQHDARLTRQTLRALPAHAASWPDADRAAVLASLRPMRSRSPSLDLLLDAPAEGVSLSELRLVLEDLDRRFGGVDSDPDIDGAPFAPPPRPRDVAPFALPSMS